MSKRRDGDYLKDIMEAIKRIKAYSDKIDYDEFLGDINWDIVWDVITNRLPLLEDKIKKVIEKEF